MTELDTRQFIVERKQTLQKNLAEAQGVVEEARRGLAVLEREYKALENLERQLAPKEKREGKRGPRGGLRRDIARLLREKPEGLAPGEIVQALGMAADDRGRTSIKNALYAMTKAKNGAPAPVSQSNGKFVLASSLPA